ncbi:MAG: 3-hydroxyacyl-[acyl-carrier-protein] dehydratase FabZ [Gammaproteobacteria bacterium]|nr:MAG: 3-hydroxyacyl-[acyl-carrier-protein] dehydratase FabZ [Gammaproteobacteria bacterium]RLA37298.1 MAG: 3-hydroxyacyl-[acyl-carrier-protein] dehydratase FabZ [Gammaproteobacteria bacterium]
MDAMQIMETLPHRYPFLLIDKITACEPGESITAVKNVSINEPFFQGHFPGKPVMPGVLVIEAMAQAGGVLSHVTLGDVEPKPLFVLAGVNNARFRRFVAAGDQLVIDINVEKVKRGIWFYKCTAMVGDELAVAADVTCTPGGSS